ncbi:hypothetical protein pb186bvf_014478 [Paramecium bursaria]
MFLRFINKNELIQKFELFREQSYRLERLIRIDCIQSSLYD